MINYSGGVWAWQEWGDGGGRERTMETTRLPAEGRERELGRGSGEKMVTSSRFSPRAFTAVDSGLRSLLRGPFMHVCMHVCVRTVRLLEVFCWAVFFSRVSRGSAVKVN